MGEIGRSVVQTDDSRRWPWPSHLENPACGGRNERHYSRPAFALHLLTGKRGRRIVLWNDAARELLGFAPDEVLARHCYELLGGTDESGCTVCRRECANLRAARRGVPLRVAEVHMRTRDAGRIRVSVSTIALPSRWHELSVLAHLFRSADARKDTESSDGLALDRTVGSAPQGAATGSGPTRPIDGLTKREDDVLRLLSTGASTATICARLAITTTTTRTHVRSILQKLGVRDRLEAVTFALRAGLIEIRRD